MQKLTFIWKATNYQFFHSLSLHTTSLLQWSLDCKVLRSCYSLDHVQFTLESCYMYWQKLSQSARGAFKLVYISQVYCLSYYHAVSVLEFWLEQCMKWVHRGSSFWGFWFSLSSVKVPLLETASKTGQWMSDVHVCVITHVYLVITIFMWI